MHFALIGLPPTATEIDAFVNDVRPDALRRVVDRLLADPEFGVRWSRHWLDLVRYGETYGHEFDYRIPEAWQYRDYVIEAMNSDLPYDQFAKEQLAGDLLEAPRGDPIDRTNQSKIGSAFWWLGEAVHAPVDVMDDQAIRVDNQIDVAGKAFLGMTIACARCHDHKFDAISQADYTALVGLLQSTGRAVGWRDPGGRFTAWMKQAEQANENLRRSWSEDLSSMKDSAGEFGFIQPHGRTRSDGQAGNSLGRQDLRNSDQVLVAKQDGTRLPNAAQEVLFDLSGGWPTGATADGWAFRDGVVAGNAMDVILEGEDLDSADLEWHSSGWLDSRRLGRAAQGVWRSPNFVIEQPHLLYQVAGDGGGRIRVVIDGYFMLDYHKLLFGGIEFKPKSTAGASTPWTWHVQRGDLHHYIGHTAHLEVLDEGDGWVGLARVIQSSDGKIPSGNGGVVGVDPGDGGWTPRRKAARDRLFDVTLGSKSRVRPLRVLQATSFPPKDAPLAIRGNVHDPGPVIPRGDLTAFASGPTSSGAAVKVKDRFALADRWASSENPLFARVAVNRLWHHVFGRGIVSSCDNFGVLGEQPTHPDLLDHLADDFADSGWSTKRSLRRMLVSRVYASQSKADGASRVRDPQNKWLGRSSIRRLEGEAIRDSLLKISGSLDHAIGGHSVPIHLTEFMTGRGRPGTSGPLDGDRRRSVFVEVRRNFLWPFMAVFDRPQPSTSAGRRNRSNVPSQALAMLNDPMVDQLIDRWCDVLARKSWSSSTEVVEVMYRQALARSPQPDEVELAVAFVDESPDLKVAIRDLADVLINTKEFIYLP
ncbi:MAG: DUF1549 and DUF1553 domain-containing protein [Planctomycetota bacterium]